jgi:Polyprenyltransferase (cytochrome oxidase assembly factor)
VGYSLALLAVSVLPAFFGLAGTRYLVGSLIIGLAMVAASVMFLRNRNNRSARRLFMTSNLYLIALMILLVVH